MVSKHTGLKLSVSVPYAQFSHGSLSLLSYCNIYFMVLIGKLRKMNGIPPSLHKIQNAEVDNGKPPLSLALKIQQAFPKSVVI